MSNTYRYFRHASGEMYVISKALAKFISINRQVFLLIIHRLVCILHSSTGMITSGFSICRSLLRSYAHDDVTAGSWFIGLDATYIDEGKFCCSSWSAGLSPSIPNTTDQNWKSSNPQNFNINTKSTRFLAS